MYDLEFRIFARYRSFVKSKWRAFRYVVRLSSYLDVLQFPRFISFFSPSLAVAAVKRRLPNLRHKISALYRIQLTSRFLLETGKNGSKTGGGQRSNGQDKECITIYAT